jgi:hypothetical protein
MRTRQSAWFVAILLVLHAGAIAQDRATGAVRGVVRDADSGVPLADVTVEASSTLRTRTDNEGRYEMRGVPEGRVQVSLQRVYTSTAPPYVPGTVRARQTTTMPELRVRLQASLSGQVTDDAGQPVAGATVFAIMRTYSRQGFDPLVELSGAELWYHRGSRVTTDDRGRFRFDLLEAGRTYYLLARSLRAAQPPVSDLPGDAAARPPARAAMYYPSARSIELATPIVLSSREDRADVGIVLPRAPSRCVSATLARSGTPESMPFIVIDEDLARDVTSQMTNAIWSFLQAMQAGRDGKIRVCGLYEGRFTLIAGDPLTDYFGPTTRAVTTFQVDDHDLDLGLVSAESPLTVTGRVIWDRTPEVGTPSTVRLISHPSTRQTDLLPSRILANVDTIPSEFQFQVTRGTRYIFTVFGMTPPVYLKDVRLGGRSILGRPFTDADAGLPLEFVMASDAGSIAVQVREAGNPASGAIVIALIDDANHTGNRIIGSRMVDDSGTVTFEGLPPRAYRIVALRTPPLMRYNNGNTIGVEPSPETLASLAAQPSARRVEVRPLESVSLAIESR